MRHRAARSRSVRPAVSGRSSPVGEARRVGPVQPRGGERGPAARRLGGLEVAPEPPEPRRVTRRHAELAERVVDGEERGGEHEPAHPPGVLGQVGVGEHGPHRVGEQR